LASVAWSVPGDGSPTPSLPALISPATAMRSLPLLPLLLLLLAALPRALVAQSTEIDRGVLLYKQKQLAEAKAVFTPPSKAGDAMASYWLGRIAMDEDKVDDAIDHLERAAKANDKSSEIQLWLGRAYGEKAQNANVLKQPGLARKTKGAWERAIALDPSNLDARADLVTYYMVAPGIMGGSKDKAHEQVEQIRKLNAYRGGFEAARLAQREKNAGLAETELRTLAKEYPDSSAPVVQLGLTLQNQQKWDEAFALFDGVLAKKPDDVLALYQLGKTAAMSGKRLDAGETALRKYLAMPVQQGAPTYAGTHYRLGQIEERRGERAAARLEYEMAVRLDPKLEDAKKGLARVK
jgi:tetratricopeptide (TPR) repeat protein